MSAPKINNDPRLLAACPIDKDRWLKVRIAVVRGKVLIDLRAYVEIGSRSTRTPTGVFFPVGHLQKVIAALQRADATIKEWDLEDAR